MVLVPAPATLTSGKTSPGVPPNWPDPHGFIPRPPAACPPPGVPSDEPVMQHMKSYCGNDADFTTALQDYYYSRDDARMGGWGELFAAQRRLYPVLLSPAHLGDAQCAWRGWRNASSVEMVPHPIRKSGITFTGDGWKRSESDRPKRIRIVLDCSQ